MKLLLLFLVSQYFGQNKIQYKDFDFSVLKTEHFAIYFYEGEEQLAAFARTVLEETYLRLKEDLATDITFEIPVIIYNSPNEFSQTNVTLELIEESVGGFTEIFKNRVVVPFDGSYESFRHVLAHELTHVFEFSIFFGARMQAILSSDLLYNIPLWVFEGLAEYESLEWDVETDIFLRDLTISQNLIPLDRLELYGGYVIYKVGQSFYHYVAQKYGRKKIGSFIHSIKVKKNLEDSFQDIFGVSVSEFSKNWQEYNQIQYWPKVLSKSNLQKYGHRLIYAKKFGSTYNTSATISPKGDRLALISDRVGSAALYIISTIDGTILKRLVTGEYSAGYESMHLYRGGISWSPDEKLIAFAAKGKGRDVLYLLEVESGNKHKEFFFEQLQAIFSPRFSPDGNSIIFAGLADGASDLYILSIATGNLKQLTNDVYDDRDPAWSPDGETIVFVSDRPDNSDNYQYGAYALFTYQDGRIVRLTQRSRFIGYPFYHPTEPYLLFVADYDSAHNIYLYSLLDNRIIKKTNVLTSIAYPSISRDGVRIAFTYFNETSYDVWISKNFIDKIEPLDTLYRYDVAYPSFSEDEVDYSKVAKYKPKFTFDYLAGSVGYTSFFGVSGTGNIVVSDILGNHRIYIYTDLWGNIKTSNFILSYWYIPKRTDYGFSLFQFSNHYRQNYDYLIWRYLGGSVLTSYPLSKFLRFELGYTAFMLEQIRIHDFFVDYVDTLYTSKTDFVSYPDIALVYDNAQWAEFGPRHGTRCRLETYKTIFSNLDFTTAFVDYRRYFGLSPRTSFVFRLVSAGSFGQDPEFWSFGGPGQLRGYDFYEIYGSKIGFANLELRFPFVDRLKIAFPLPIEIRNIRGCLFTDIGGAYTDTFKLYEKENGWVRLKDLKMDVGFGLRANLFFFIFKLDFAKKFDLYDLSPETKIWFSIGPEF